MKTAIVVPTVPTNKELLEECLESIEKYSKQYDYEVFVEENDFISFAYACNQAIKKVLKRKDEFNEVFLFNDDMKMTNPDWLMDFRKVLHNEKAIGVVVPKMLYRVTHIAMGFSLFKREVFEDVGLFDERFKIGEIDDVDFSVRMQQKEWKVGVIDGNVYDFYTHKESMAFKQTDMVEIKKNRQRFRDKWKGTEWENMDI